MSNSSAHQFFNPNHLDEAAVTHALAAGKHAEVLQAYFGEPLYAQLRPWAERALAATPETKRVVYLLPGLLGSQLALGTGRKQRLLWLDPQAVIAGKLIDLALGRQRGVAPIGVMLPGYLLLKLVLQAAGFQVRTWAYDWRRSIVDLGRQLADAWQQSDVQDIMVVAHSMGGLVTRAALMHASSSKVSRVIQMGTPNQGSWAMLQVLRGAYPTVRKLGALDRTHDTDWLVDNVFHSFTGFYEMLPQPTLLQTNWLDADSWPSTGLQARREQLRYPRRLPRYLAAADSRCHCIVGTGQVTTAHAQVIDDQLQYDYHADGDGTVPVPMAQWSGAQHWYVSERHGLLPLNSQACKAVPELLHAGVTASLPTTHVTDTTVVAQQSDAMLRSQLNYKVRWDQLPLALRRELLEPVIPDAFVAAQYR